MKVIIALLVGALTVLTYSKRKLVTPEIVASFRGQMKKSLGISREELPINLFLLSVIFVLAVTIRIPRIESWWIRVLRPFPFFFQPEKEPLSATTGILHYAGIALNIGIFRRLYKSDADSGTKKRRGYAIAIPGIGCIVGTCFLWSHSTIGSGLVSANQATYNLAAFFMTFSSMALGGLLVLPTMWATMYCFVVAALIMKGIASFETVPGMILILFGLVAFLAAPMKDFSLKFKIGHVMILMSAVVMKMMDMYGIDPGSDLDHTIDAAWVVICAIVQRS